MARRKKYSKGKRIFAFVLASLLLLQSMTVYGTEDSSGTDLVVEEVGSIEEKGKDEPDTTDTEMTGQDEESTESQTTEPESTEDSLNLVPSDSEENPNTTEATPSLQNTDEEPEPTEEVNPSDGSLAGKTLKFINLYWETDNLGKVEAVFDGGEDEEAVKELEKGKRGVYETTIPKGDYSRVSFRKAGSEEPFEDSTYNFYGVDVKDAGTESVSFVSEKNNTFYYDMGENPSYWGADPEYEEDEAAPVARRAKEPMQPVIPDPEPGDMVYALDLDEREKFLAGKDANTYRVHIGFLQVGHDENIKGLANIPEGEGEVYTMYEKETGVYSAPFPENVGKYGEIGFALVKKEGQGSPANPNSRHFNFRGKKPEGAGESANKFGYFKYHSGYTDTYYMNSSQDDSYWGAHPSNADQSLDTQVLYVNVEDGAAGNTSHNGIIADPEQMWISWNNMPKDKAYGYEEYEEAGIAGYKIKNTLPHEWVRYFQFPKNSNATENTILTIQFRLKQLEGSSKELTEEEKQEVHSYKFTYVPRSQMNCVNMDYIWEFNGKMWEDFEAGEGLDSRSIFFASIRNKYDNVWIRVAKEKGKYADKEEIENWLKDARWSDDWINKHIDEVTENGKTTTWLKLDKVIDENELDKYNKEKDKLFTLTIPGKYKNILFRTKLDGKFFYSKEETISDEVSYPCYFAYQIGEESAAVSTALTGYWASVYASNTSGDQSVDIPNKKMKWEEDVYYIDTTMYDYYSDIETTGQKVAEREVPKWNGDQMKKYYASQSRVLNAALEEYYKNAVKDVNDSTLPAIYTSAFPEANNYSLTGSKLWNSTKVGYQDGAEWRYQNRWTGSSGVPFYGIVADELTKDGKLLLKDKKNIDTNVEMPLFNEEFLRGNNSMDMAVGNVYKNVKFPIKQNTEGYWQFDSGKVEDTVRLSYDVDEGYFMDRTGDGEEPKGIKFRNRYTFYPFNDADDWTDGYNIDGASKREDPQMTKANVMFGSRFEFPFALPDGKKVYDQEGKEKDIIFEFQGDDDAWIYIDGILVLDLGGIHNAVRGRINLTDGKYYIYTHLLDEKGQYTAQGNQIKEEKLPQTLIDKLNDPSQPHKITMFYMERGLTESNLKLTFNLPRENNFTVEKEVDVESTRVEGKDDIFAGLLENMGGFNFNISNLVTNGKSLGVESASGFKTPTPIARVMDLVSDDQINPHGGFTTYKKGSVEKKADCWSVTQDSVVAGERPDEAELLKIDPGDTPLNVIESDYLRLSMVNNGYTDRNAHNLYISFVDTNMKRVGGYARTLGYNGEANTFLSGEKSVIRVDFKEMTGDSSFNWSSVDYMLIGIRRNDPESQAAAYDISYATFFKEMEEKPPIGFYVKDEQISDYGSYELGKLSPVDRAWYVKQSKNADGKYDTGVSWNTEEGTFNLADGQRAVFTDKFRTGSYIQLKENREPKIFDTEWTLKEGGKEIPARYLLTTRNDVTTVKNPYDTITKEYPLTGVQGDQVWDKRKEILDPEWDKANGFVHPNNSDTIVYRSYQDPDSSVNLGTALTVTVKNTLKRGSLTIRKELTKDSADPDTGKYKPADFSFKIYYTDIAGRGLEKQLAPAEEEYQYLMQEVTVHTNDEGWGEVEIPNIPAGTKYWIEEVPINGTKLEDIKLGDPAAENPHEHVSIQGVTEADYKDAYVIGTAYASNQKVTFTNSIQPFYMDIEKIWRDGLTDDKRKFQEVHIVLERKTEGSEEWVTVTRNYFNNEFLDIKGNYIVLSADKGWKTTSTEALPVYDDTTGKRYTYRIRELNDNGVLNQYEFTPDAEREDDYEVNGKKYLHVTYQAINTPANLLLKKEWKNPDDTGIPPRIRVKLMASANYDPNKPEAEANWVCYKKLSAPLHNCNATCYISLSKASDWTASMRNLPMQNDSGKKYYYQLADEQILIDGGWKDMTEAYGEVTYGTPVTVEVNEEKIATLSLTNKMNFGSIRLIKENKDKEKLEGAEFKIERLVEEKGKPETEWKVDDKWIPKNAATNNKGEIFFNQLQYGTYRITETKAPGGYLLNREGIIVTIPGGKLADNYDDVKLEISDQDGSRHNIVLTIKNAELYELPSTGGPGIYRYMISGVALMIAALFILYNKRRRGERV